MSALARTWTMSGSHWVWGGFPASRGDLAELGLVRPWARSLISGGMLASTGPRNPATVEKGIRETPRPHSNTPPSVGPRRP